MGSMLADVKVGHLAVRRADRWVDLLVREWVARMVEGSDATSAVRMGDKWVVLLAAKWEILLAVTRVDWLVEVAVERKVALMVVKKDQSMAYWKGFHLVELTVAAKAVRMGCSWADEKVHGSVAWSAVYWVSKKVEL